MPVLLTRIKLTGGTNRRANEPRRTFERLLLWSRVLCAHRSHKNNFIEEKIAKREGNITRRIILRIAGIRYKKMRAENNWSAEERILRRKNKRNIRVLIEREALCSYAVNEVIIPYEHYHIIYSILGGVHFI